MGNTVLNSKPLTKVLQSVYQHTTLFHWPFFLMIPYLRYVITSLMLNSQTAAQLLLPEEILLDTCVSSVRHIADFLASRNTKQHFSTILGGILNNEITIRKHKNVKKYFIEWTMKNTLTYIFRVETRRQILPCVTSVRNMRHKTCFSCSAHVQECKVCADLGVTNTLQ